MSKILTEVAEATGLSVEELRTRMYQGGKSLGCVAWEVMCDWGIDFELAERMGDLEGWPKCECKGHSCQSAAATRESGVPLCKACGWFSCEEFGYSED